MQELYGVQERRKLKLNGNKNYTMVLKNVKAEVSDFATPTFSEAVTRQSLWASISVSVFSVSSRFEVWNCSRTCPQTQITVLIIFFYIHPPNNPLKVFVFSYFQKGVDSFFFPRPWLLVSFISSSYNLGIWPDPVKQDTYLYKYHLFLPYTGSTLDYLFNTVNYTGTQPPLEVHLRPSSGQPL